jgi:Ca-activated chloride channel homolog
MKKKFAILLLAIFALSIVSFAQSGRRVKPAPTPAPVAEQTQEPQYSESAPNRPRPIYSSPTQRNTKSNTNSKNQTKVQVPNQPAASQAGTIEDDEVLRVETNLITIPISVYDRHGLYIPNLRQADFKIFEDGEEQEIAYFGTSEKPFSVILLIDVSPSTAYKIEDIRRAAIAFVDQLKAQDSVMVVQFDSSVNVLTELTNDRQRIYRAINRANFGNGTSLYEAVDFSLRRRLNKVEGRKAIVLFTDGVDTTSRRASFEGTIRDAEESDAMIFPIYYNTYLDNIGVGRGGVMTTPPTIGFPGGSRSLPRGMRPEDYARGRAYLDDLAAVTGGRVFRPESTPGGLISAFEAIAEELRRQYSIGYYPQNEGTPGQRKQIKVRVNRPNLAIRARDSYIVGTSAQAQTNK